MRNWSRFFFQIDVQQRFLLSATTAATRIPTTVVTASVLLESTLQTAWLSLLKKRRYCTEVSSPLVVSCMWEKVKSSRLPQNIEQQCGGHQKHCAPFHHFPFSPEEFVWSWGCVSVCVCLLCFQSRVVSYTHQSVRLLGGPSSETTAFCSWFVWSSRPNTTPDDNSVFLFLPPVDCGGIINLELGMTESISSPGKKYDVEYETHITCTWLVNVSKNIVNLLQGSISGSLPFLRKKLNEVNAL